jgi:hypothetical protein
MLTRSSSAIDRTSHRGKQHKGIHCSKDHKDNHFSKDHKDSHFSKDRKDNHISKDRKDSHRRKDSWAEDMADLQHSRRSTSDLLCDGKARLVLRWSSYITRRRRRGVNRGDGNNSSGLWYCVTGLKYALESCNRPVRCRTDSCLHSDLSFCGATIGLTYYEIIRRLITRYARLQSRVGFA